MENVWSRSWRMTQLSFSIIRQDKELLVFPFLSMFFSLAVLAAFWVPLNVFFNNHGSSQSGSALEWVLLFLLYFTLTFCATFFNVCAVHIVKKRLEGGKEPLSESFAFAFSRIGLIASWSLAAATVSVLFRMLESLAGGRKRSNPVGMVVGVLVSLLTAGLEISWTIVTLFVVPAMVYKDMGPLDAVKESTRVIKKTWGESLLRNYGLGLVEMLALLGGAGVLVALGLVVGSSGGASAAVYGSMVLILAAYVIAVLAVFSMANTVFNTALYVYGSTGKAPEGYPAEVLEKAFRPKS